MSRKRTPGSRRDKAERKRRDRLAQLGLTENDLGRPNARILALREVWSFIIPTKSPEGRVGSIDQDICDGIGQLHALGLLANATHDPQDLRDKAREWGNGFALLFRGQGIKVSKFERADKGHKEAVYSKRDMAWDAMDQKLTGYERGVLMDLIVDPLIGPFGNPPWAQSLIDEALLQRGRIDKLNAKVIRFPTAADRDLLEAAIRGMAMLCDSGTTRERKAA